MNELISVDQLSTSRFGDDNIFNALATSSDYLPRLQLFGANSEHVKNGKIPMAHWGIVIQKDQLEDLGNNIDVVAISWRPKAMRMSQQGSAPEAYFDPELDEFREIQKQSENPDSNCSYGPEFLVWVPKANRFATYFMNSKTARRQAQEMRSLLRKGATLKIQLIKTKQYSWHGPVIQPCLTQLEIPALEEVQRQADRFNNPERSATEFDTEKLENGSSDRVR